MNLKITRQLDVDFHNDEFITINAKQYDRNSRFILITCYHQGLPLFIDNAYYVYIRFRKPDGFGVFNRCETTNDGKIRIELTEQMLSVAGTCYADLVILENEYMTEELIENPAKLIETNDDSILSTMSFRIRVFENAFDNVEIESSYEYNALNELMIKATEDYTYVMTACKISETNAKNSENAALLSETKSKNSETNAKTSETKAKTSEVNAKKSETNAKTSETNAGISENNAKTSETNAKISEDNSKISETNALESENNSKISETNAKISETNALSHYNLSKSYAVGDTGVRENENTDNARYYYDVVKAIVNGLNSGFIPMGSIFFSELATVEKATGFTYNIKDSFITDDTFAEGTGKSYSAGTNVFYRFDGLWDCFGGEALVTATVDEVKEYLNIIDSEVIS